MKSSVMMDKTAAQKDLNRKKQSVLDVGQRNQYDMMQAELRRNNDLLTTLRRENKELRIAQQQAMRGQLNINVADHYQKAEDLLHNKMCILKRSLNAVKGKNAELAKEIDAINEETNFIQVESMVRVDSDSGVARKIGKLENRLDNCFIKHNEVNAIRRTYETLLERLQLEQSGFDIQLGATECALQNSAHELEELMGVGARAVHERDGARGALAQLRARLADEKASQERDLERRRGFIADKREVLERKYNGLLVKVAQQEERHAKLQQSIAAGGGGGSLGNGGGGSRSESRRRIAGRGATAGGVGDRDRMGEIALLQKQKEFYYKLMEATLGSATNNNSAVAGSSAPGTMMGKGDSAFTYHTHTLGKASSTGAGSSSAAAAGSTTSCMTTAASTTMNNNSIVTNPAGDASSVCGVAAVIDAFLSRRKSNQSLQETVAELQACTASLQSELTELQREWDDVQRSSVGRVVVPPGGGGGSTMSNSGTSEEKEEAGRQGVDNPDAYLHDDTEKRNNDDTRTGCSPLLELRRDAAHKESRVRAEFAAYLNLRQDELTGAQEQYDRLTHLLQHVGVGVRGLAQKLGLENIPPVGMSSQALAGEDDDDDDDVEVIVKRPPGHTNNHTHNNVYHTDVHEKALQKKQQRVIARERDILQGLLGACARHLREMQSHVTLNELWHASEALRNTRMAMPETNTRVSSSLLMADGYALSSGEHAIAGMDYPHSLANGGASAAAVHLSSPSERYDTVSLMQINREGGNGVASELADSEENGNDGVAGLHAKKARTITTATMTAGGAGMNAVYLMSSNNNGQAGDLADDFPDSEIHNRAELKMMSLATVEREVKKARKQQQQRQRHKEEGM